LEAVDAEALAAAPAVAVDTLTAALPVVAEALSALPTAGVLRLAAEVTRALATAPSRIWAEAWLAILKDAITMVAMMIRFIKVILKLYPSHREFVTPFFALIL
jgi:hypothetical protein